MNENNLKKNNVGIITCIFIILILAIALVGMWYYYNNDNKYNKENINNGSTQTEKNNSEEAIQNESFEESLVNYIVESIKIYAQSGYIIKDTTGDITASKLTIKELENNIDKYKQEIKSIIEDNSIFGTRFIRNGKECCTYNLEKILNKLELGTHMGMGIGCYDANGNKIYEYGKTNIEEYESSNSNVIKYFGYDTRDLVNDILNEIEECAKNNNILKDTTGDVTAQKLTVEEFEKNKSIYETTINDCINDIDIFPEIYFENNELICKCYFEKVLNKLEIGTHMGIGIDTDEEGIKIFSLK